MKIYYFLKLLYLLIIKSNEMPNIFQNNLDLNKKLFEKFKQI